MIPIPLPELTPGITWNKSFSYSVFNLSSLFVNARLAAHVGVEWWQHRSEDGRSLRAALDYLAPFADPERPWRKKDIAEPDRSLLLPLLAEGSLHWKDGGFRELLLKFGSPPAQRNARWRLIFNVE